MPCDTVDLVAETMFSIVDGAVVPLVRTDAIPAEFLRQLALQNISNISSDASILVRTWGDDEQHHRPDLLLLDGTGTLLCVLAETTDVDSAARIRAIDEWLAALGLRELGYLGEDPLRFYEQLWDISPDGLLALRARRYLLISADERPAPSVDLLASATIERWVVDVYSSGDTVMLSAPRPLLATTPAPVIDLVPPQAASPAPNPPVIRQGALFRTDRLPLLFDPHATDLTSISDQLFTAGDHVVMVEPLSDGAPNPFTAPDRYDWPADIERLERLQHHRLHADGSVRTTHLFIEAHPQSEFAMYVGELAPLPDNGAAFSVTPPVSAELFRQLQAGRLPQQSFASTTELSTTTDVS